MKKILLISVSLLFGFVSMGQNQLLNSGFENWHTDTLKNLDGYVTSVLLDGGLGTNATLPSTDSYSGDYSLFMQTFIAGSDTAFGAAINFDPDHFSGGESFSFHANFLNGYYKAGVQESDTALVLVILKKNGEEIAGAQVQISAAENTNTWTKFTVPTGLAAGDNPDTILFGAVSSNAINEIGIANGSWLMIDSVYFTSDAGGLDTLNNFDFERWDNLYSEQLDNFNSSMYFNPLSDPPLIEKITDASQGDFAAKLNTVIDDFGDETGGLITTGNIASNVFPLPGGAPFTGMPAVVFYNYQNFRIGNEAANIDFTFKKNGQVILQADKNYSSNTEGYVTDSINFEFPEQPDTLLFNLWNGADPGSWFIIDNIEFYYLVGINELVDIEEVKAFPNPANDYITLKITARKSTEATIDILDLTGKVVKSKNFELISGDNRTNVNVSGLSQGSYLYRITIGDSMFTRTFIKN